MRHLGCGLITFAAVVSGCSGGDPCSGISGGVCIGLEIRGSLTGLDQLAVTVDKPTMKTLKTPEPPRAFSLPIGVAVVLPPGTKGTVNLHADGLTGGHLRGSGSTAILLPASGSTKATVNLIAISGGTDLAGIQPGDLGDLGSDLATSPDLSLCIGGDGMCGPGCNALNDSDCKPVCGNKAVEPGEICDDGNTANGDGCDPTCQYTNTLDVLSGRIGGPGFAETTIGQNVRFNGLSGVASDGVNLYVADSNNFTIMKVNPATGESSVLAGTPGLAGNVNATGRAARFNGPDDLVYFNGSLFVTDKQYIRSVDAASGLVAPVATLAAGTIASGLHNDAQNLYFIDAVNGLSSVPMSGGSPKVLATMSALETAAGASAGCGDVWFYGANAQPGRDFYVTCTPVLLFVKVPDSGAAPTISVVAGTAGGPQNLCDGTHFSSPGKLFVNGTSYYVADSNNCRKLRVVNGLPPINNFAGNGTFGYDDNADPLMAQLVPNGVLAMGSNVYATSGPTVRAINGGTHTVAGRGPSTFGAADLVLGSATVSRYTTIAGLTSDGQYLYAILQDASGNSFFIRVSLADGSAAKFAANLPSTNPRSIVRVGNALYVAGGPNIYAQPLDGSPTTVYAGTGNTTLGADGTNRTATNVYTFSLATDGTHIYYFDEHKVVRKIDGTSGIVTTIAGSPDTTDTLDGTGAGAHFNDAFALTSDGTSLYILEGSVISAGFSFDVHGSVVRKIELSGKVTTVVGVLLTPGMIDAVGTAARLAGAPRLACDGKNLFLLDVGKSSDAFGFETASDTNAPTVRRIRLSDFSVTTMVGERGQFAVTPGVGVKARLNSPREITYDATTKALYLFDELSFLRIR